MKNKNCIIREIAIDSIQPTKLFLSKSKYDQVTINEQDYNPILVRKTGDITYLIDHHEELLYMANKGHEKINVCYYDNDSIDTLLYFTRINQCNNKGIKCIKDLSIYLLNDKDYKRKWEKPSVKLTEHLYKTPYEGLDFVRETNPSRKSVVCDKILRTLPEWFGIESAIVEYNQKVKQLDFIKIKYQQEVIGFCAYQVNYGINCDLYVLGIYRDFHRFGIGSKLIEYINDEVKKQEVKYLSVKTLSDKHVDSYYERTRNFYIKNGFYPFEEFKDLWGKENPCLLMIKEVQ
ncbi:MAG: GNAT family N-acetyltransferase [Clostridiales bacterium]|nr:GNAT family N-acetyltransferase [Clostridiales bacterium]